MTDIDDTAMSKPAHNQSLWEMAGWWSIPLVVIGIPLVLLFGVTIMPPFCLFTSAYLAGTWGFTWPFWTHALVLVAFWVYEVVTMDGHDGGVYGSF